MLAREGVAGAETGAGGSAGIETLAVACFAVDVG